MPENIPIPDDDIEDTEPTCECCDNPESDCECNTCQRGTRSHQTQDPICESCDRCPDHCECYHCPHCNDVTGDSCGNCDNCPDCCGCISCADCGERNSSYECGSCERGPCCGCSCDSDDDDDRSSGSSEHVAFFNSPLKFHDGKPCKTNPSKRYVAVEIEVSSVSRNASSVSSSVRSWSGSIVRDGSLPSGGFEINTAPASGDAYVKQVTSICEALDRANAKADRGCGLHVHIDARDYSYYDLRRLIFFYAKAEKALFRLCAPSRSNNHYCMPCGSGFADAMRVSAQPKESKKNVFSAVYQRRPSPELNKKHGRTHEKYDSARYTALNIHSWFFRGTIECRMHHGTINAKGIKHWGILWARILDYCLKSTEKAIEALPSDGLLALLQITKDLPETHYWLLNRTLYFAKREGVDYQPEQSLSIAELAAMRLNARTMATATPSETED